MRSLSNGGGGVVDRGTMARENQGVKEGDDAPMTTDLAEDAILHCNFNLTLLESDLRFLNIDEPSYS